MNQDSVNTVNHNEPKWTKMNPVNENERKWMKMNQNEPI